MVDNARKVVLTVDFAWSSRMPTDRRDAISPIEIALSGRSRPTLKTDVSVAKSGPRRRCISIPEMVGKTPGGDGCKQVPNKISIRTS